MLSQTIQGCLCLWHWLYFTVAKGGQFFLQKGDSSDNFIAKKPKGSPQALEENCMTEMNFLAPHKRKKEPIGKVPESTITQ